MGKAEDLEGDEFSVECIYDGSDFIEYDGEATFTVPEVTVS